MEKHTNSSPKRVNHYRIYEVIDTFKIEKNRNCEILKDWVKIENASFTPFEFQIIDEVRQQLEIKWDEWNEEELKMNFISFVFFIAKLEVPYKISTFYERKFSGKVNDITISLIVDCMLASPKNSGQPKSPYFFMQEFKQSLGDGHDPEGQMLAAMILAQELNKDGKPIYGCWIQGRIWYFTILNGTDYCVSKVYDSADAEDLLQIVFILRKLKDLILNR